jgi:hypothetical protein
VPPIRAADPTEAVRGADDGQLLRRLLHTVPQALIDAEAAEHIGADPHERTHPRTTQRNGTRDKTVSTAAGDLTVQIAKTRTGSLLSLAADAAATDLRRPGHRGGRVQHADPGEQASRSWVQKLSAPSILRTLDLTPPSHPARRAHRTSSVKSWLRPGTRSLYGPTVPDVSRMDNALRN